MVTSWTIPHLPFRKYSPLSDSGLPDFFHGSEKNCVEALGLGLQRVHILQDGHWFGPSESQSQ